MVLFWGMDSEKGVLVRISDLEALENVKKDFCSKISEGNYSDGSLVGCGVFSLIEGVSSENLGVFYLPVSILVQKEGVYEPKACFFLQLGEGGSLVKINVSGNKELEFPSGFSKYNLRFRILDDGDFLYNEVETQRSNIFNNAKEILIKLCNSFLKKRNLKRPAEKEPKYNSQGEI